LGPRSSISTALFASRRLTVRKSSSAVPRQWIRKSMDLLQVPEDQQKRQSQRRLSQAQRLRARSRGAHEGRSSRRQLRSNQQGRTSRPHRQQQEWSKAHRPRDKQANKEELAGQRRREQSLLRRRWHHRAAFRARRRSACWGLTAGAGEPSARSTGTQTSTSARLTTRPMDELR